MALLSKRSSRLEEPTVSPPVILVQFSSQHETGEICHRTSLRTRQSRSPHRRRRRTREPGRTRLASVPPEWTKHVPPTKPSPWQTARPSATPAQPPVTTSITPAGGPAGGARRRPYLAIARAMLRGPFSPRWYVPRHAQRQVNGGPSHHPCRDAPQSVRCAEGEWQCRGLRGAPRIPRRCDAPRNLALLGQCGTWESWLSSQLPHAFNVLLCPVATDGSF